MIKADPLTSGEFGTIGHIAVGARQHHRAVFAVKSGYQAFRSWAADPKVLNIRLATAWKVPPQIRFKDDLSI